MAKNAFKQARKTYLSDMKSCHFRNATSRRVNRQRNNRLKGFLLIQSARRRPPLPPSPACEVEWGGCLLIRLDRPPSALDHFGIPARPRAREWTARHHYLRLPLRPSTFICLLYRLASLRTSFLTINYGCSIRGFDPLWDCRCCTFLPTDRRASYRL